MPTQTWERLDPQRREAVTRAAEREFARHGFSGGSLNVIAREAGVAKGSLFQYFEDKADLYAHLSELASLRIRAAMEERIATLDWADDFFAGLTQVLVLWQEYFFAHPTDRAMTEAVNLQSERSARFAIRSAVNRHYVEVLEPLIAAGQASGSLRADADDRALLGILVHLFPVAALAPHNPGLDPVLGLGDEDPAVRRQAIERVVATLAAAFGR